MVRWFDIRGCQNAWTMTALFCMQMKIRCQRFLDLLGLIIRQHECSKAKASNTPLDLLGVLEPSTPIQRESDGEGWSAGGGARDDSVLWWWWLATVDF